MGTIKVDGEGNKILKEGKVYVLANYSFESEFEEKFSEIENNEEKSLEIIKNRLDITEFLWQNILVEIPLKVVNEKNQNLSLKGNGWRFVTEEELEKEKSNNSPFSELYNLIDSRKE